jgi:hypothetical protein
MKKGYEGNQKGDLMPSTNKKPNLNITEKRKIKTASVVLLMPFFI